MTAQIKKLNKGFTLIELLVVIGILAILLAITLIAINPARQFSQANDTKRRSDVNAILNAIGQYQTDQKGALPGDQPNPANNEITTTAKPISAAGANLCSYLVTTYIAGLPTDPTSTAGGTPVAPCNGTYVTGYTVVKSASDNRVTVSATGQIDPTTPIAVTR